MSYALYGCITVWVTGLVIMIMRLWYFKIQMLNNMIPGVSPWDGRGGMFDSSHYNATGQMFHRRLLQLYGITVAFGIIGILLIAAIGSMASRFAP